MSYQNVDISLFVTELVEIMRIQAKQQKTFIFIKFEESVPKTISLDTSHFQQVFINLLTNAIKFTHDGKIEI